ncbi:DUF5130 domain-containing protein [Nocardioides panacisoli]|uniref:DUF5130 family protein n=1 Tax=Nocardioides panacisoli TaxID=627624 RepID=UPI001C6324EE|nr:DUF5130 family protein [Nocardioides panacisoli]QYJ04329.1 DUF5130 domain-containing protein [Nocardioides panacisoli]
MASSDFLTTAERTELDKTIRAAERACRAEISVFLGDVDGDPRDFATSLHNTLFTPTRSVLIMVDPSRRCVEVVTGGYVRRTLTDDEVARAVTEMTSAFAAGDLAGGLSRGVQALGEYAKD